MPHYKDAKGDRVHIVTAEISHVYQVIVILLTPVQTEKTGSRGRFERMCLVSVLFSTKQFNEIKTKKKKIIII